MRTCKPWGWSTIIWSTAFGIGRSRGSGSESHPAGNLDPLTGDPAALRREQHRHGSAVVVGQPDPAERGHRGHPLVHLGVAANHPAAESVAMAPGAMTFTVIRRCKRNAEVTGCSSPKSIRPFFYAAQWYR